MYQILLSFFGGVIIYAIINKMYYILGHKIKLSNFLKKIPQIDHKLKEEKKKLEKSLVHYIDKNPITVIPEDGMIVDEILKKFQNTQKKFRGNKNTGACYINDKSLDDFILKVYEKTIRTNPLHVSLCNDILRTEAEIVSMVANLYHGDKNVVGNVTTGGTDSIFHAVYTARERARHYGMNDSWEIILPSSAHPAFRKAANICRIKIVDCPIDNDFRMDITKIKKFITSNTIMIVCSCPTFPHGAVDPIEKVSALLNKVDKNKFIGLHVDCCMGSFVVPYMEENNYQLYTNFDFRVDRVTSISVDTHKYGYTDKGSSIILYKNHEEWRQHQIFVDSQWTGGVYATPTMSGSRSGKDIAGTWATLLFVGNRKYCEYAKNIVTLTRKLKNIICNIPELRLLGDAAVMIVAFESIDPNINIYNLQDEMMKKGWYLSSIQYPNGLHFCVTASHTVQDNFEITFEKDLIESIKIVRLNPQSESSTARTYKSNQTFGIKDFVPQLTRDFWNFLSKTNIDTE